MYGIDISNHNREFVLSNNMGKHLFATADFVWMKATEGKSLVDKSVEDYVKKSRLTDKDVIGFYHYARPDLNTYHEEAMHFCAEVKRLARETHSVILLSLDWEGPSLSYSTEWALNWLRAVEETTGIKPLVYVSESVANSAEWDVIVDDDYGLWVAKWSSNKPEPGAWPFYAFHQYASSPVDLDIFNGTASALKKYGKPAVSLHG